MLQNSCFSAFSSWLTARSPDARKFDRGSSPWSKTLDEMNEGVPREYRLGTVLPGYQVGHPSNAHQTGTCRTTQDLSLSGSETGCQRTGIQLTILAIVRIAAILLSLAPL